MSLLLRRKLEDAFVGYLRANAASLDIASDSILSARAQSEPAVPFLIVEASRSQADPDAPQISTVELVLHYRSAGTVDGTEREAVDEFLEKLHTLVMQPQDDDATWSDANPEGGALRAALNKPLSGPDNRTVKPLHVYQVRPSEDSGDVVQEGWVDQLVYTLIAQPMDSH